MDEKIIQLAYGQRLEYDAKICCVTNFGLIFIKKEDSSQQCKTVHIYISGEPQRPHHLLSVIAAPQSSIPFAIKEEL